MVHFFRLERLDSDDRCSLLGIGPIRKLRRSVVNTAPGVVFTLNFLDHLMDGFYKLVRLSKARFFNLLYCNTGIFGLFSPWSHINTYLN
jgi:hypothetical protein